jgi:hypothetical protein
VSRFFETAREIVETAESAASSGLPVSDVTILMGHNGSLHFISDCDWPLDSLVRERGAEMAYRVKKDSRGVRVEGQAGSQSCQFSMPVPKNAARQLLGGSVWYPAMPLADSMLPAGTSLLLPAACD